MTAGAASEGRSLRFLANVDPIDVARALDGLNPEETMVVIISKTFTTTETMLNARTLRTWLNTKLGGFMVCQLDLRIVKNLQLPMQWLCKDLISILM